MRTVSISTRAVSVGLAVTLLWVVSVGARGIYQLGGGARSWSENGTLHFVDPDRHPGSIQPFYTEIDQDLARGIFKRGGSIRTSNATEGIPTDWKEGRLTMVDGDSTTAFVHEPQVNIYAGAGHYYTVDMRFDLGAPFPVERIRIRTRPDHPENLLRIYKLWVNDGSEETRTAFGDPIYTLLKDEPDNLHPIIDLRFDPRVIRYFRLVPWKANVTWEVAEVEVYGQGYVPEASFESVPLDLGGGASLGRIHWAGHYDPKARITLQTRTGWDDQPEVYWRKTGVGDQQVSTDEKGRPLTRDAYEHLSPVKKGDITEDLENWSVWQTYEFDSGLDVDGDPDTGGTAILSPSPRRYVQVRIGFQSQGVDGGRIDSLWFEYSRPPLAREATAEIAPLKVNPAESTHFTYYLRLALDAGQRGFDQIELRTPAELEHIDAVRVEGRTVDFGVDSLAGDPPGVRIHIPRVDTDQERVEVDLTARVFRYGTVFDGAVGDSQSDEVPLRVTPGNAVDEVLSDAVRVKTVLSGDVLGTVVAQPNPFSPNGDGVNDELTLRFDVLSVTHDVPVTATVWALSGRRVRTLDMQEGHSSRYELVWDGRDDAGKRVPPGVYVYRVEVKADDGTAERMGCVALAY